MAPFISDPYPIGTTVKTGDQCPATGSWAVVEHTSAVPVTEVAATIDEGRIMPHYLGEDVTWRFAHYGL